MATTSTTTSGLAQGSSPDLGISIIQRFTEGELWSMLGVSSIFGFLSTVWGIYVVFAYIFAALCLYGFVYASIRLSDLGAEQDALLREQEQLYQNAHGKVAHNSRWQEVLTHVNSDNPNDWRLAIIEADIMLEDALKSAGYAGTTLGERLRSITPNQLQSIDDAWTAHRVRNEIAHAGADFVLTKRLANDTIAQFERTFKELGVI